MMQALSITKPEPIQISEEAFVINHEADLPDALDLILNDHQIIIDGSYGLGLKLLNKLQGFLKEIHVDTSFEGQRSYRNAYQKYSNQVLLQVRNYRIKTRKSPTIGWLQKLYYGNVDFFLSFPQIQGLNSAWQWYIKGVEIPVLKNKIHPYYNTYFPTRFEHLILFDTWLDAYTGAKESAIDVGIGSGVLTYQLLEKGFKKIQGTDANPNAIKGMLETTKSSGLLAKVELDFGHLFGKFENQTELIVFNPPWLPSSNDLGRIDEAIYYPETLFPSFFEAAAKRLLPDGKLVLLFSNLAEISGVTTAHPIRQELENEDRFVLEKLEKSNVKKASNKTKRDQNWRADEEVELWVLKLK